MNILDYMNFMQQPIIADKFSINDALNLRGALSGNPFNMLGLGIMALQNLPPETPEQKTVKSLYDLDDIGRVRSGIMAGYNPVSGFGPTGLSGAMDRRLDTIRRTELKRSFVLLPHLLILLETLYLIFLQLHQDLLLVLLLFLNHIQVQVLLILVLSLPL